VDFTLFTKWTVRLLYLQIVLSIIAVLSGLLEYNVLTALNDGTYASEAEATAAGEANDLRQGIVGMGQLLVAVVSGIWILRWIYRANVNVRELGATGMEFSPGWSVGWYFVPIANLWKPFQALKEIWQASARPRDWQNAEAPGLLAGWWTLWLVSSVAGRASFRMSLRADEIGELLTANRVTLMSDLLDIPLSIVFVFIVKAIHDMQTAPPAPAGITQTSAIDAA
jgi:hypothetical protein